MSRLLPLGDHVGHDPLRLDGVRAKSFHNADERPDAPLAVRVEGGAHGRLRDAEAFGDLFLGEPLLLNEPACFVPEGEQGEALSLAHVGAGEGVHGRSGFVGAGSKNANWLCKVAEPTTQSGYIRTPPTPDAMEILPALLRDRRRWVIWRFETRPGDPKPTKVPYMAEAPRRKASSMDVSTWGDYRTAVNALASDHTVDGIGFVFAEADGFWGLDLDGCCPVPFGPLLPEADALVRALDSYAEYSPSGTGVHVICRGVHPAKARNRAPLSQVVAAEAYCRGRYFTVTGRPVPGTPCEVTDQQWAVDAMCREPGLFSRPERRLPVTPPAVAASLMQTSDGELLAKMFAARNGADVKALFYGVGPGAHASQSEGDMALCSHLLYWTGGDEGRADRLFRQSARMRPKWDESRGALTYGQRTLASVGGSATSATCATSATRANSAKLRPLQPEV